MKGGVEGYRGSGREMARRERGTMLGIGVEQDDRRRQGQERKSIDVGDEGQGLNDQGCGAKKTRQLVSRDSHRPRSSQHTY